MVSDGDLMYRLRTDWDGLAAAAAGAAQAFRFLEVTDQAFS